MIDKEKVEKEIDELENYLRKRNLTFREERVLLVEAKAKLEFRIVCMYVDEKNDNSHNIWKK